MDTMVSSQVAYCLDPDGRLLETRLGSGKVEVLSDHSLMETPRLHFSPDGNYILYGGTSKQTARQRLYMYDLSSGAEYIVLETPEYDSVLVEFSPDSKTLALLNISYPHRQELANEGVFLVDVATRESRFKPYPDYANLPQNQIMGSELKWSVEGDAVYIAFNGRIDGNHVREYHCLDPLTMTYRNAAGRYESGPRYQYVFKDQKGDIATYKQPVLQWQRGYLELASPAGKWMARVKGRKKLVVSGRNRKSVLVDSAARCACGACTIRIKAWIDGGRLLMYETEDDGTFLFEPESGRKRFLFNHETVRYYGWPVK